MTPITIKQRLKPFSHIPGTYFILPGTTLRFQIFPALIRVHDLKNAAPTLVEEIKIGVEGPVKDFTILQDLEKGKLCVWGQTAQGYLRYSLLPASNGFAITVDKKPLQLHFESRGDATNIQMPEERLSLGSHKAQNCDILLNKEDLSTILPIWLRLGQTIPGLPVPQDKDSLLQDCFLLVKNQHRLEIANALKDLLKAGFDRNLSPRSKDEDYHGFRSSPINERVSPLYLLTEGSKLIRKLFIDSEDNFLHILPVLPPEFHSGRFINFLLSEIGVLSIEWTKHTIRRMILKSTSDKTIHFSFQSFLKKYRLRLDSKDKGVVLDSKGSLSIEKGKTYSFDRFEK